MNGAFPFGQQVVWQPKPEWTARSNLKKFMDVHQIDDYDTLPIATRLKDAGAKYLFTADGMWRRGKVVPMKGTADTTLS